MPNTHNAIFLTNADGTGLEYANTSTSLIGSISYLEEYTFLASGWNNDEYSLEADYPSSYYDILDIASSNTNTTDTMLEAWQEAGIYGAETTTNKVVAHNAAPAINIVMTLVVRKKTEIAEGDACIAPLFSSSETYDVGEYVIYEDVLYKCTTAVETAGAWTGSTNWTETTVADELSAGGSSGGNDGFEDCETEFNNDGSITQTYDDRVKVTTFNSNGSITEELKDPTTLITYITKTTVFNNDGSITETVVEV